MNKSTMRSAGNLLIGFALGGLIGAVVALLMAPQTGDQVRAMLRDRSSELKDKAMSSIEDTRSRAESAISSAKDRAGEMIGRS